MPELAKMRISKRALKCPKKSKKMKNQKIEILNKKIENFENFSKFFGSVTKMVPKVEKFGFLRIF